MDYRISPASSVISRLAQDWQAFANDAAHRGAAKVVLRGGDPAAIGTLKRNLLHPHPRQFSWMLAEGEPADALTPLLQSLILQHGEEEGDHAIHVSLHQSNQASIDWATSLGFQRVMTTHLGTLLPMRTRLDVPITLRRLADADSPCVRHALAGLHAQIYRLQHNWNPPAPIAPEVAEVLFLDEQELMPEAMWYATDDFDRPVGVSSLRKTARSQVVELGWIGILPAVDDSVLQALIASALNAAGDRAVNLEVDENQEMVLDVLQALPVIWRDPLLRYEFPAGDL